ncbi:SpoIIE family protein phosphatase [Streptomyces sp. NPDC059373]
MTTDEHSDRLGQRASFDMADAVVVLLDARGRVTSWSGDAERLLGYPAVAVIGREVADLLIPEDAARLTGLVERYRRDGDWLGLLSARHRDGHLVRLMVRAVPAGAGGGWVALLADMTAATGWDMSRSVLERLVTRSPIGIGIVDTNLRFVWSNLALEQFGGVPARRRLGRRLGEIQPGLDAELLEARMREVLETGVSVIAYEHVGRTMAAPHREQAHSMSFVRLEDDGGRPLGVYYTVVDITDRYRARRRLALLDRAGQYIGRTLDVMQTAQDLSDVAVPDLADFVAVDLLDPVIRGDETAAGRIDDANTVTLRRSGQQSVREGVPEAVVEIGGLATYHAWSPSIQCLTSGSSWLEERLDPLAREWASNIPGGRAARFLDLGLHSAMVVPIRARGITLGITTFFRRQRDEPFDRDDLRLAEEVVARAAVCIDNARRYTRERDAALALQHSLLPHETPDQEAVDVASCYRPGDELARVGGGWFDVIPLSGARVALVVGDVVGHGIDAAATMGRLRTAVQTLADLDLPPEELLAHLDDLVGRVSRDQRAATPTTDATVLGASCLYLVYDPVSRRCSMAGAGHPPPAVLDPGGTVTFPDLPMGPALGIGGLPFESIELTLDEGSVIALYTDGLLAGQSREGDYIEVGQQRLRLALEGGELPLDGLCHAVVDSLLPARPIDDAAVLLARTRRLSEDHVATWDLPVDPAFVARAREMATERLHTWGLDDLAFTTELVVSELVTNAIRHATGPIQLRLIRERTLICEVSDGASTAPHLRHPRTTDEGGRGLFLIAQFSQRWGTRYHPDGKIIWAEQSLTGPA